MGRRFAVVGFGHLGKAFAQALVRYGSVPEDICVCARSEESREVARKEFGFSAVSRIEDVVRF